MYLLAKHIDTRHIASFAVFERLEHFLDAIQLNLIIPLVLAIIPVILIWANTSEILVGSVLSAPCRVQSLKVLDI